MQEPFFTSVACPLPPVSSFVLDPQEETHLLTPSLVPQVSKIRIAKDRLLLHGPDLSATAPRSPFFFSSISPVSFLVMNPPSEPFFFQVFMRARPLSLIFAFFLTHARSDSPFFLPRSFWRSFTCEFFKI